MSNINSNKDLNLLSEFILKGFESEDNIVEVCNCENFVVIKGVSTEKDVVSMKSIFDLFNEKYQKKEFKNVIDLIEYKSKISRPKKISLIYSKNETQSNNFFEFSNFPFGYSMNQGKLLYFYFKHIVDRIPTTYPYKWIKFNVEIKETGEIDFDIQDDYLNNENDILKSLILDCFDFNLIEFEKTLKKMDLENYILNPSEKNLLDDIVVEDFFFI